MSRKASVTVAGSITKDFIWRPGKRLRISLGGLLYNTVALSALMPDATVVPVANVGKDVFNDVAKLLSHFTNVSLEGMRRVDRRNARCYLNFESGTHSNDGSVVPITLADLERFLDADIVMLTFPTGHEMTLRSLKSIRRKAKCPLYIDYHMLVHGGGRAGTRPSQGLREWADWISVADFAQFNRFEAGHLLGLPVDTKSDALSFGRALFTDRTRAIVVTLGKKGSFVIRSTDGGLVCDHISSPRCRVVIDTLGSGDVYSAGFIAQYLQSPHVVAAAYFASRAAAQRCGAHDFMELFRLLHKLV